MCSGVICSRAGPLLPDSKGFSGVLLVLTNTQTKERGVDVSRGLPPRGVCRTVCPDATEEEFIYLPGHSSIIFVQDTRSMARLEVVCNQSGRCTVGVTIMRVECLLPFT